MKVFGNETDEVIPPDPETSPILLLRFTSKATPSLISVVKERIVAGGMLTILTEEKSHENVVLGITSTHKNLLVESEVVKLAKRTDPNETFGGKSIIERFTVASKTRFLNSSDNRFFTSAERAYLCSSMLESIPVLSKDGASNNLSRELNKMKIEFEHHVTQKTNERAVLLKESSKPVCHVLEEHGLIDVVSPVNDKVAMKTFVFDALNPLTPLPLEKIRTYYGEELALYFGWMEFYTRMLIVPALVGAITVALRIHYGDDIDDCPRTPFVGVFMFFWGVAFLRMWDREESRLAYRWGTFQFKGLLNAKFDARREFQGELRPSPVTGYMEKYYPTYKRQMKQLVSAWVTLCMLSIAFVVIIMSLNLQGYVHPNQPDHNLNSLLNIKSHPFHFPAIAALSEKGAIFDATSTYCSLIPTLIHVVVIQTMNTIYRQVAEKLTEWENYETDHGHQDSLILKRFAFEAFDAFLPLFYLAFYERDIVKLRSELVQVFNIDMFRRFVVEFILPRVTQIISQKVEDIKEAKKFDITKDDDYTPLTDESELDEYEEFDDYLEMVIQLGYITLFASAYPFASAVALIANMVEVRTDLLKLTQVCRRPRPYRVGTIGTWKIVLICTVWLSALTNCLIFGMTSNQLMELIPNYLISDSDLDFVTGKGSIAAVVLIFGLERLMLVVGLIIYLALPSVPEDVLCELQRIQFVEVKESLEFRRSNLVEHEKTDMRPNVS